MRISDWSSDVGSSDLDAIIGTNTSALSITEIAAVVTRPERVIGMHFFNPVHKMKLVELICGLATDVATLEASRQWIDAIGKASITVNESPGFTTSRMSALDRKSTRLNSSH